jgi:hypothetical protein
MCSYATYGFNLPWLPMEEIQIFKPITLGNLSLWEKTHLNEINNIFLEFNKMDLQTT